MKKTHFVKKFTYFFTCIFIVSTIFSLNVYAEESGTQKTDVIQLNNAIANTDYEFILTPTLEPASSETITWTAEKDILLEDLKEKFNFTLETDNILLGLPEEFRLDPTGILSGKPTKAET